MLIFISSGNVSRKDGIEKFDSPVRGGRNKEKKLKYFVNQKAVNTKNISRLLLFLGNKAIGSVKTKP